MGEVEDKVGSLPKGYESDPLFKALSLPVPQPKSGGKPGTRDLSQGESMLRRLDIAEQRVTGEGERLTRIVTAQRGLMTLAGPSHAKALTGEAEKLSRVVERALETIRRERSSVASNHKTYLSAPSTRNRDVVDSFLEAVDRACRDPIDALEGLDAAIGKVLETAATDLERAQKLRTEAERAWEDKAREVEALRQELSDFGSSGAEDLAKGLAELRKTARDDPAAARDGAKTLLERGTKYRDLHLKQIKDTREFYLNQVLEIEKTMEMPSLWTKFFEDNAFREIYGGKMEQAKLLAQTAMNQNAISKALEIARRAKQMYDRFKLAETDIAQMFADKSETARILEYYKAARPKDYAALNKEFKALEQGWDKKKPADIVDGYAVFKTKVEGSHEKWDTYRGRNELSRKFKEKFERKAKEIEELFAKLDDIAKRADPEGNAEGYQGGLRTRLKGLRASAELEMVDDTRDLLLTQLTEFKTKVEEHVKAAPRALAKGQDGLTGLAAEIRADQVEGNKARRLYLERSESLKAGLEKLAREHKEVGRATLSDEDKREMSDIAKLMARAKKLSEARKDETDLQDIETGMALLDRCFERLELVRDGGPKVDRGKLGNLQADWAKTREGFGSKGEALVKAVISATAEDPTTYAKAGEEVDKLVKEAAAYFGRVDFSAETEVLKTDDPGRAADRKRARETALAKVRDAQGYLNTSPVMRALVENPFGVSAVGTALFRGLRRIELEVLRGV